MVAFEVDDKGDIQERAFDSMTTPYEIDKTQFPYGRGLDEQFMHLLRYAILAPSTYNTQPWKFRLFDSGIAVYADYSRRLPVADANSRELLMSVGAAILNLRIAANHFGFECSTEYNFSGDSERPIAFVTLRPTAPRATAYEELNKLFSAITRRHTNCHPFLQARVPDVLMARLANLGTGSDASVLLSTDPRLNGEVAALVERAERQRLATPEFSKELGDWIRPNATQKSDGIPGAAFGMSDVTSNLASWAAKTIDNGASRALHDKHLCAEAPALCVLYGEDSVPAWLSVGEVLQEVSLSLTRDGLQFSFFNMPIEIPEARLALRELLGLKSWPQLLLRIGYSLEKPTPSPGRAVEECLIGNGHD